MGLQANSYAPATAVGIRNTSFTPPTTVLQRKILVPAHYDPTILSVVPNIPVLVTSAEDAGARFGFGFQAHRLCQKVFTGNGGVPVYVMPVAEAAGAVAGEYEIEATGPSTAAGVLYLRIGGDEVFVSVASGTAAADIATAIAAAINADANLPFTATAALAVATLVCKNKGVICEPGENWGIDVNALNGETLPAGVTLSITQTVDGTGAPDIGAALDAGLGTGSQANALGITDVVNGFTIYQSAILDDLANYVGLGDEDIGLYDPLVARPFRALCGSFNNDILTDLTGENSTRLTDRCNGVIAAPTSHNHPGEIAAEAVGHMARINNQTAEGGYDGVALPYIFAPDNSIPWTSDYDSRDLAVRSGVSPAMLVGGVFTLTRVVSFYRPASVPEASNGYRSMRNISITQNVLNAVRAAFGSDDWTNISIVADVNKVTASASRLKARDIKSVKAELLRLINDFAGNAWIYDAAPSIAALQAANAVTVRAGGVGFDATLKLIYSGEGGILNATILFDTNVSVTTL